MTFLLGPFQTQQSMPIFWGGTCCAAFPPSPSWRPQTACFLNCSIIDEFNPLLNQDGNEMSLFSLGNASSKCPFSMARIVYQSVTHPRINPTAKAGESIMFFASLGWCFKPSPTAKEIWDPKKVDLSTIKVEKSKAVQPIWLFFVSETFVCSLWVESSR